MLHLVQSVMLLGALLAGADADVVHIKGRVLGPDGKPVAGATVTVPSEFSWGQALSTTLLARTTSDAEGRFELDFDRTQFNVPPFLPAFSSPLANDAWKSAMVVAGADRFGVGWTFAGGAEGSGNVEIRLVPDDVPIEGRLIDSEHKPLAGITVTVFVIGPIDQDEINNAWKDDPAKAKLLSLTLPLHALGRGDVTTDADGRFRLTGLGRDRRAWLLIRGTNVGFCRIETATRVMQPITRRNDSGYESVTSTIYGNTFEHTPPPARSVQGTITDAATKKPMPGVVVQSEYLAGPSQDITARGMIRCVTDEQGRYRLDGFPRGENNRITVIPKDDEPYFARAQVVDDPPDDTPATHDFELHRGVWVTGKVTDKATGEPVDAGVQYTTNVENPQLADLLPANREDWNLEPFRDFCKTARDGSYRIVVVPGKAVISARCREWPDRFRKGIGIELIALSNLLPPFPEKFFLSTVKEIEIPADAQSTTCNLELDPGEKVHVTAIAGDGKALGSLKVTGSASDPSMTRTTGPEFDVVAMAPEETRRLWIQDPVRQLGCIANVSFADAKAGQATVELFPMATVSGRLIDADDGTPIALTHVWMGQKLDPNDSGARGCYERTDADGRFTFSLPPDTEFSARMNMGPYAGETFGDGISTTPGANIDLGEIKLRRHGQ